jgi:hypothetical protein
LAEQKERYEQDWLDFTRNIIPWNMLLERRGIKDTDSHNAMLDEDAQRKRTQPARENMMINYYVQMMASLGDTDPQFILTNPLIPVAPQGSPEPGTGGGNTAPAAITRASMPGQGGSNPSPVGGQ